MKTISLLTDFGLKDGYPGIMKGVIYGIAPQVHIVDLTHLIPPQDVMAGSLALIAAVPYFPPGSVHIAVVDPGVGTARRPIAARLGEQFLVAPDNGLLSHCLQWAQQQGMDTEFVHLDQPRFWLPVISSVFHGRDIFAPVGAHLAAGRSLREVGTQIHDPVRLELPQPELIDNGLRGKVVGVDHFGNIVTNIGADLLSGRIVKQVRCGPVVVNGLVQTFGQGEEQELVALIDSEDRLSICVVNGSASQAYGILGGEPVVVIWEPQDGS